MERMKFSTLIDAPKQKVWEIMLSDQTFREWTSEFMQGSFFEGDWEQGSDILFLAPDKDGNFSGMYSRIKENRPHDYVSIHHLGEIVNGKKKAWPDGGEVLENYTFKEKDGGTELLVEMEAPIFSEDMRKMFEVSWPKALSRLKSLAESA